MKFFLPLPNRSYRNLVWLIVFGVMVGCSNSYSARTLPTELMAQRSASKNEVDLSRLASAASPTEQILAGDVLDVSIVTGLEEGAINPWPLRVADNGSINIPLVQEVRVAGLLFTEAEEAIRDASIERGLYQNPQVSVLLNQRRTFRVTVVGAVEEPGSYDLPASNCDMLTAIVHAGGLSEAAGTMIDVTMPSSGVGVVSTDKVQAVSFYEETGQSMQHQQRARFDMAGLEEGLGGVPLSDGSVVMVLEREPETIHVMGLVKSPDRFEMEEDEEVRLLDAIAMAGGRTLQLADKVRVIRQSPSGDEPAVIDISMRKAKTDPMSNLVLAPGDVISVEETPLTLTFETVRNFIRFGFSSSIPGL